MERQKPPSATHSLTDHTLRLFIYDYLKKRNLVQTASAFFLEAGITMECIPIDNSDSFLAIWWAVFWDIFTARKRAAQQRMGGHAPRQGYAEGQPPNMGNPQLPPGSGGRGGPMMQQQGLPQQRPYPQGPGPEQGAPGGGQGSRKPEGAPSTSMGPMSSSGPLHPMYGRNGPGGSGQPQFPPSGPPKSMGGHYMSSQHPSGQPMGPESGQQRSMKMESEMHEDIHSHVLDGSSWPQSQKGQMMNPANQNGARKRAKMSDWMDGRR